MFKLPPRPDRRFERRMARIARWDRPIAGSWDRLKAWSNMLLTDHGVFRLLYLNRHQVTPNFWRAAQPAPGDIKAAAEAGVKTIVNLRGGREYGSWPLEREACEAAGIKLEDFVVRSRGAPERETILDAKRFFDAAALSGAGALQVGRRPGRLHGRAVSAAPRKSSAGRGHEAAWPALRPFPLRQDRHSRRVLRAIPAGRASPGTCRSSNGSRRSTTPRRWSASSSPQPCPTFVVDRLLRRE